METNKLVEDNIRLVYHLYKKFGRTDFIIQNKDDLISEGFIGLIKAARSYIEGKSKFATYAGRCIFNEMLMYIRRCKYKDMEVSLDAPIATDDNGNELTYADIIPDKRDGLDAYIEVLDAEERFQRFYLRLPDKQRKILELRKAGCKQKQIAARLGLSQSYVSRLLRKMKAGYKSAAARATAA